MANQSPMTRSGREALIVEALRTPMGKAHAERGWIETLICPPLALVPISGDFSFVNTNPFHIDTYIHCG